MKLRFFENTNRCQGSKRNSRKLRLNHTRQILVRILRVNPYGSRVGDFEIQNETKLDISVILQKWLEPVNVGTRCMLDARVIKRRAHYSCHTVWSRSHKEKSHRDTSCQYTETYVFALKEKKKKYRSDKIIQQFYNFCKKNIVKSEKLEISIILLNISETDRFVARFRNRINFCNKY